MIFVSLLRLLAKGFDVFAWHLITLVYPLCASIRAIESNSNADNQKWLIYWVLYPLIILLELPTEKIIQWLPFWAYMKLIATCWLVEPHFDGASYVYENIVRPCFSVNPLIWKQDFFLSRSDQFLAAAQKYIKENGSEALEKLIINKTKCIEPNLAGTQNKTVAAKENRVVTLEGVGTNKKAVAAKENKGAVAFEGLGTDKAVAAKESKGVAPLERIGTENKVVVDKVNYGVTASDGVNCTVSNPTRTGIKTVTAIESKVMAAADAHRGNGTIGSTDPKKAQKKWTCALCKVSTTCEANLMDHFWGNKHKFNEETLRSRTMTNKSKDGSASTQKVKANWNAEQSRQRHQNKGEHRKKESALWCDICKKWRPDRNAMLRHLIGRHHKAKLNELAVWQLASSWETN